MPGGAIRRVRANEALINGSADCQRLALLNFFQTRLDQDEGQPDRPPDQQRRRCSARSTGPSTPATTCRRPTTSTTRGTTNQTFDVATYGTSANGTEGTRRRSTCSTSTCSRRSRRARLNEFHFTYSRENRPRSAAASNLPADTGMGFAPIVPLRQSVLPAAERRRADLALPAQGQLLDRHRQAHHQGRRRVAAHAQRSGVPRLLQGPLHLRQRRPASCATRRRRRRAGSVRTRSAARTARTSRARRRARRARRRPAARCCFYLQGAGRTAWRTDAAGASDITNEEFSLFVQDKWQVRPNVDAQLRPALGRAADAGDRSIRRRRRTRAFLNDPTFPSDGTIPISGAVPAARRLRLGRQAATASRWCARSAGIYYARQNMLSQVGSVTTNGMQQKTIFASTGNLLAFGAPTPVWPNVLPPSAAARRAVPALHRRPRVRPRLPEPAHLRLQRRLRARAGARLGRLRRLHLDEGQPPDAVPQLQPHGPAAATTARHRRHRRLHRAIRSSCSSATCSSPTAAARRATAG